MISADVQADRQRIKAILELPEASGANFRAAVAIALEGATPAEARVVLQAVSNAMTPEEVAASVNKQMGHG